jgi:activator of HSP90 ATPase
MILRTAIAFGGVIAYPWQARGDDGLGLTRGAEAIRQEQTFRASSKRVYDALTDAQQFDKVMRLSAAMRSMATGTKPAEISRDAGGAFSVFGGYVSGRQIELVPNQRIVQVWRPQTWGPGVFSIVKFELSEQGAGTKIVLDHRGFPDGTGEHLAEGWRDNYWKPLQQYLEAHE